MKMMSVKHWTEVLGCILVVIVKPAFSSHSYASTHEIKTLYLNQTKNLDDPVEYFLAVKELLEQDLVEKSDLLGAAVGLTKILDGNIDSSLLQKTDISFLKRVNDLVKTLEAEKETSIDFELGRY